MILHPKQGSDWDEDENEDEDEDDDDDDDDDVLWIWCSLQASRLPSIIVLSQFGASS